MPRTQKPGGFEIASYSPPSMDADQAYRVIRQIFVDLARDVPSVGMWADVSGDMLKIHYHAYEMFLPSRIKEVEARADAALRKCASHVRSEFKSRTGYTLTLAEQKDLANRTIEKVSLNERYYYKAWRFYRMTWA